jgi:hypothetical protein
MAKHTRNARQREPHGKGSMKHTAKKDHTAMIETSARQTIAMMLGIAVPYHLPCARLGCTATTPFPCVLPFAVRHMAFSFLFYFI